MTSIFPGCISDIHFPRSDPGMYEWEEKDEKKNEYTYSAKINLINGGNYGYTFRAMPKHEMMLDSANLNLVKWITD